MACRGQRGRPAKGSRRSRRSDRRPRAEGCWPDHSRSVRGLGGPVWNSTHPPIVASDQRQPDGRGGRSILAEEPCGIVVLHTPTTRHCLPGPQRKGNCVPATAGSQSGPRPCLHLPRDGGHRMSIAGTPEHHQGKKKDDGLAVGPGRRLFAFVRHWSRRQVTSYTTAQGETMSSQGRLVLVAEAVHALSQCDSPTTVNAVASEIGIDQSGASRLIKAAIQAGVLETVPTISDSRGRPTPDARRRETRVTDTGLSMLADAHVWQEQMFSELTAGWTQRRRRDFAGAMEDMMSRSHELDSERTTETGPAT